MYLMFSLRSEVILLGKGCFNLLVLLLQICSKSSKPALKIHFFELEERVVRILDNGAIVK